MGLFKRTNMMQAVAPTTRPGPIATTGIDATATVTAAAQTGTLIDMEALVEVSLTVIPASGLPPYPATLTQPVNATSLPRVGVGAILNVKVDAEDPQSIWIDFASRPA